MVKMRWAVWALLLGCGTASAATGQAISLVAGQAGFVRGVEHYYPVEVQPGALRAAVGAGGLWLPQPDGGRVFVRSAHLVDQGNGIQTWVGKVGVPAGERSVVITTGPGAAFGTLYTARGEPFRLTTRQGRTFLVQRDAAAARLSPGGPLTHPATSDYRLPPRVSRTGSAAPGAFAAQASAQTAGAAGSGPAVVDVLLGYTPGMITRLGSSSAVLTRLYYLIDLSNQAYEDSQVNHRIHLAGVMQVNYPDNSDDNQVLDDLTNTSPSGPLAALRARRAALGADLVSLLRPFSYSGQNKICGLGYLLGDNETPFTTDEAPYGYSTASDGDDPSSNYYCLDTTLTHEMGHNMGLAHEKADASEPGAFSYAYGWRQSFSTGGSFATIMAYSTDDQEPLAYFADPNITLCNGHRCGDPTTANQTLALNQTMPIVAAFRDAGHPALDLNGDHQADILLQSDTGGSYSYLYEQDHTFLPLSGATQSVSAGYRIAAIGDFNGDGRTDLVWTSAANDLYVWINNGAGGFQSHQEPSYAAGWTIVGAGDLNGDGDDDLLWSNASTSQFSYWIMQGSTLVSRHPMSVTAGTYVAAIGDFNGDGLADLAWTSAARDLVIWTSKASGGFNSATSLSYPAGWRLVGGADMNGDHRADLVWIDDTDHQFAYWLMNGATRTGYKIVSVSPGYSIVGIDRYGGNANGILWTSASRDLYEWRNNGTGNFTSSQILAYPATPPSGGYYYNYPSGWSVVSSLPASP